MAKQKTHKATVKRFTVSKNKKIKHRKPGQAHFNSRDTGNASRKKRRDSSVHGVYEKTVKTLIQL